jgi:hypothetical protein
MTHAHGRVEIDHSSIVGRLRVAVGHADDHGFLQAQYILEIGGKIPEQRQFRGTGIAEDAVDAESPQQAERRFPHRCHYGPLPTLIR